MVYILIALFATIIGSMAGIGGGMIMRPMFALLGIEKGLASFTSSATVLSMALTNLITALIKGKKIKIQNIVFLGAGGVIGGFVGGDLLRYADEKFVNIGFLFALGIIIVSVLFSDKLKLEPVKNPFSKFALGLMCGVFSSFFGIGGGPFLMAVLLVFFRLEPSEAAFESILITLMTVFSSIIKYSINGYADFSLWMCIPAGIIGGLIGRKISGKLDGKTITLIFDIVIFIVLGVQVFAIIS